MVFSSLVFICIFLPVVFLLYTVIPSLKVRNGLLIAASLVFYAYGEPVYVFLMIASSIVNYFCARLTEKGSDAKRRTFLIVAVVINLGVLCVFKYTGMIITSVNSVFGSQIPVPEISLPIGISFFTFQALSYVIDVYRKRVDAQKNYFRVLLYISFFPQLIAGPIVKYRDIEEQIMNRKQDAVTIARGFRRFICGLAKKVFIANAMGAAADAIFSAQSGEMSVVTAWIAAISYLFQIYYDFGGYSDMAIGLGQMFGFQFKENFLYPYGASSIQEFWRRWHVSLSTWFKEYLYIPLGGNRKGKARTVINRLIVFFLTGLWHGANWTFVLWGLWHGLFLLIEEFIPKLRKLPRVLGSIYTMLVVCVGFVMFRADSVGQGFKVIADMFSGFNVTSESLSLAVSQLTPWFIIMLVAAVLGAAPIRPIVDRIRKGLGIVNETENEVSRQKCAVALNGKWKGIEIALYVLALVLLAWCILRLSGNGYNPFIYFKF